MKKINLIILLILSATISIFAQSDKFNYQAAIRGASGEIMQNESVSIAFSIKSGSASGTEVYAEIHSTTTNDQGLVNLSIGSGSVTSGTFSTIDLSANSHFLNIEIDGTDMGTSEFQSVPYASYAQTAGNVFSGNFNDLMNVPSDNVNDADADVTNEIQTISLSGTTISLSNGGGNINLPTGTTDTDDQNLTLSGTSLTIDDGTGVNFTGWDTNASDDFSGNFNDLTNVPSDQVNDADASPTNEIQVLSISNDTIFLTDGGFAILPSSSGEFVNNSGIVSNTTNQANSSFVFGSNSIDDVAGTDDDGRMFFNKTSGAFRVGEVTGTQWNSVNVGLNSTAMGLNTTASGGISTALGFNKTASGAVSTAMGDNTTASGAISTAMGEGTTASGNHSTAIGNFTTASGDKSTAIGHTTEATATYSTAIGHSSIASGVVSTAMGLTTKAQSFAETSIGSFTENAASFNATGFDANDRIFTIGNGTNAANTSNAMVVYKNGDVQIDSLAGTGARQVFADANGVLTTTPGSDAIRSELVTLSSLTDSLLWEHPEHDVKVFWSHATKTIRVENDASGYWDIAITAIQGSNSSNIVGDIASGGQTNLALTGSNFGFSFTINANREGFSALDGFSLSVTCYTGLSYTDAGGLVTYW